MAVTVMIVANDKTATSSYAGFFNKKEYTILMAHSGRQAIALARVQPLDAIVVDITSLRLNAKNLCRKLKSVSYAALVLIALPNSKIDGAFAAASVVTKPVIGKKLVARVKTAIESKPPRILTVGKLALDLAKHKVTRGSKTFSLTPKEFGLLRTLMECVGQVVSRKTLMKQVWETEYLGDTRTLDVHVRWLRKKVEENPSKPLRLTTARGNGYKIEKEDP